MRCVRSVSILIFLLVLAFGIFFPIVYADDTAVIATTITTEPTVTTNVSTAETTRQAEITPATPVPTDSGTIQPTETITPATTETPIPTAAQITTIPIMTHEPSQAALNLPATTLVTTITTGATATPTPTLASSGGTCSAPQVSDGTCTGSSEQYPAMHLSQEQLDKIDTELSRAPRVSAAPMAAFTGSGFSGSYSGPPLPRSVNLLPYLPYTLSQRDQGSCGNCWVWASTGALEISHAVQNNVKDRLSIQYFNSNYNHTTTSNACCGGWLSTYTDWYNADTANRKPIPWSNTNAGWGGSGTDYSQSYCNAMSKVSYNSITNSPNYPVSSMSSSVGMASRQRLQISSHRLLRINPSGTGSLRIQPAGALSLVSGVLRMETRSGIPTHGHMPVTTGRSMVMLSLLLDTMIQIRIPTTHTGSFSTVGIHQPAGRTTHSVSKCI
jgi:hypothetical protein